MKGTRLAASGALAVALMLALTFAQAAAVTGFVGEPSDWTFVGAPLATTVGISDAAQATFENHVGVPVLGLVLMVLHNSLGQTVYYTTGTVSLPTGSYGTVLLVATGVAPGKYSATIFVMSLNGLAISNSTTIAFDAN